VPLESCLDLILRKRDGGALSAREIETFISGVAADRLPDYQVAALLMAVFFRGLDADELSAWTAAMLASGEQVDLSHIPGAKIDKHSTGGVGDKVSLCLAPLVAACGVRVPMISGRGLGHTGGTLDKLQAIPGFRVDLDVAHFREQMATVGACLIGQTDRLAPADRRLYALRDVTGTVESIPLIAASILSKKLAEGIDGLVLDVKVGRGAFMKDLESARELARTLIGIGERMGKRVSALLTDMDQPLGLAVGNALEVREALEFLGGGGPEDLAEVTLALGEEMLRMGEEIEGVRGGSSLSPRQRLVRAREDGSATRKFQEIVAAQGGEVAALEGRGRGLPAAPLQEVVRSEAAGWLVQVDAAAIGRAAVALGAGRGRLDDVIDPAVGLILHGKLGSRLEAGGPLCTVHYRDPGRLGNSLIWLRKAFSVGPAAPPARPLIFERLGNA
jgi:pyrimidine-nucleoside phosphorylase